MRLSANPSLPRASDASWRSSWRHRCLGASFRSGSCGSRGSEVRGSSWALLWWKLLLLLREQGDAPQPPPPSPVPWLQAAVSVQEHQRESGGFLLGLGFQHLSPLQYPPRVYLFHFTLNSNAGMTFILAVPHVLFLCLEEEWAGLVMVLLSSGKLGCSSPSQSCFCGFTAVIAQSQGLYWQLKFLIPAAAQCWLSSFLPSINKQGMLEEVAE